MHGTDLTWSSMAIGKLFSWLFPSTIYSTEYDMIVLYCSTFHRFSSTVFFWIHFCRNVPHYIPTLTAIFNADLNFTMRKKKRWKTRGKRKCVIYTMKSLFIIKIKKEAKRKCFSAFKQRTISLLQVFHSC